MIKRKRSGLTTSSWGDSVPLIQIKTWIINSKMKSLLWATLTDNMLKINSNQNKGDKIFFHILSFGFRFFMVNYQIKRKFDPPL